MTLLDKRIYLVSRSPRRRELLKQIGVNFELLMLRTFPETRADVDETPLPGEVPEPYTQRVCLAKARAGWMRLVERRLPRFPVLGADTTVTIDGEIIGKPQNIEDAERILARLSGREHQVCTAVTLVAEQREESALSISRVRFRELSATEIRRYVETGEPMDKAGAYAVQGRAAGFISDLAGSYSGVMGLPLFETAELLRHFGMPVL